MRSFDVGFDMVDETEELKNSWSMSMEVVIVFVVELDLMRIEKGHDDQDFSSS